MTAFGSTRLCAYLKVTPSESQTFFFPEQSINRPIYDTLTYQSPLNGIRTSFVRGYHWEYEVILHLYKLSSETARRTQMDKWLGWIGDNDFKIKTWGDANFIEEVDGVDAFFTLEEATPSYFSRRWTKDLCTLLFISNTYVQYELSHP